jgi:hypothetical protein
MGNCLFKTVKKDSDKIISNNIPNIPNTQRKLSILTNLNDPILTYFFITEIDKKYYIINQSETYFCIVKSKINNSFREKLISERVYAFQKLYLGCIQIYNFIKKIDKILNSNFSIRTIRTTKYIRNKYLKYFVIFLNEIQGKANTNKANKANSILYGYDFIKGLQCKKNFKYYLDKNYIMEINKKYFANKIYIYIKYSYIKYNTHKILILNKYELNYYSKYFICL